MNSFYLCIPYDFQISGRLFSDSGPRRSTRLSAEAGANAGSNAASIAGNGTNNSSKYLGSSKLSSAALRSVTVRKVSNWANENFDDGEHSLEAVTVKNWYFMPMIG